MKLDPVSCKYGAPMGRRDEWHGCQDDLEVELEWVPFVDGGYDYQGAYWGAPDNLYCAVGTLDGEEVAVHYLRAADRDDAWAKLQLEMGYENCTMLPENGSLVRETITSLKAYRDTLGEEDDGLWESVDDDIGSLYCLLEDKGLV